DLLARPGLADDDDRDGARREARGGLQLRRQVAQHRRKAERPLARRAVEIGRPVYRRDRVSEDEEGAADLDHVTVGEDGAARDGALEARAVLRSEVLQHPPPLDALDARVRGRQEWIRHIEAQHPHAALETALGAPRLAPAE